MTQVKYHFLFVLYTSEGSTQTRPVGRKGDGKLESRQACMDAHLLSYLNEDNIKRSMEIISSMTHDVLLQIVIDCSSYSPREAFRTTKLACAPMNPLQLYTGVSCETPKNKNSAETSIIKIGFRHIEKNIWTVTSRKIMTYLRRKPNSVKSALTLFFQASVQSPSRTPTKGEAHRTCNNNVHYHTVLVILQEILTPNDLSFFNLDLLAT